MMGVADSRTVNTAIGPDRYDDVSIALHWMTAALVVLQFVLSLLWDDAEEPVKALLIAAHTSFGVVLTAVLLLRIVWRLQPGHRVRPAGTGWDQIAATGTQHLLYALLVAEIVLGFLFRWSGTHPLVVFGLAIPSPFAPWSRPAHHFVGEIHEWNGWAIIIVAAGHAAAALYRHYVLRDGVLGRMLPAGRGR